MTETEEESSAITTSQDRRKKRERDCNGERGLVHQKSESCQLSPPVIPPQFSTKRSDIKVNNFIFECVAKGGNK